MSMEAKEKEKSSEVNGCLSLADSFYSRSHFLLKLFFLFCFLSSLFLLPVVFPQFLKERQFLEYGVYTTGTILEEQFSHTYRITDYYTYRISYQTEDSRLLEARVAMPQEQMEESRSGMEVLVVYDSTMPSSIHVGEIINTMEEWYFAYSLLIGMFFVGGYILLGGLFVKFLYPKPKIKVTEGA